MMSKSDTKSMGNLFKNDNRERNAKSMENDANVGQMKIPKTHKALKMESKNESTENTPAEGGPPLLWRLALP